eukprot:gnl/Chilomastix_cuspidata/8863.p2 GENE.gnl/Chilomastix_cuspidata/8863~~gnl/Chilomastix_cuspidata/8863.p2  ORF type:complete len:114 (+),score=15.59 gnl/Chilomastix_cuspidata/8863:107-448(+)
MPEVQETDVVQLQEPAADSAPRIEPEVPTEQKFVKLSPKYVDVPKWGWAKTKLVRLGALTGWSGMFPGEKRVVALSTRAPHPSRRPACAAPRGQACRKVKAAAPVYSRGVRTP